MQDLIRLHYDKGAEDDRMKQEWFTKFKLHKVCGRD